MQKKNYSGPLGWLDKIFDTTKPDNLASLLQASYKQYQHGMSFTQIEYEEQQKRWAEAQGLIYLMGMNAAINSANSGYYKNNVAESEFKGFNFSKAGATKPKWWHPGYVDELTDSQILMGVKQSPEGLSTLGSATRSEALSAGEAWAGKGATKMIDKATGEVVGFKSADGMRAFRIQYKPKEGMFRANFQQNEMVRTKYNIDPKIGWGKKELNNVHIDILD